ncbi:winged helix-turn-helix transcriptional regulator [Motilibacter deserti]|uniref:Helix-turn-helix transcriptional regulator n=1 Tax=Motilibacter deserti TaxID=2714956 RepID=A0ABX0GVE8_9ACTN|nr:helix-turn-helix domain-containing protein [Motilibacter deserti]NHC14922.1 helix-turn-helix transcriptional regulator [Motilibacter deserti]
MPTPEKPTREKPARETPPRGDYCPITVGVDVLGDRWTPLVIRELMVGATGFNEIHRGLPRMSRTLLAQRLRQLERQGLVRRGATERGRPARYELTPAGEGLTPIVWALGHWAAEWVFGDPADDECDGLSLLWRMHQHAVPARLPEQRTVVHVQLSGPGAAQGWLDIDRREVSVCRDDPGLECQLAVEATTADMQRWLVGLVPFGQLVEAGAARLLGPSRLVAAFPTWFDTTFFAEGLRRRELREQQEAPGAALTPA